MNFLFLGDIMGRAGRNIVIEKLPSLVQSHKIDFVIANGENSAGGYGITQAICKDLFKCGVDVITSGNHIWDQKETIDFIREENRLLRPWNWGEGTPGNGFQIYEKKGLINKSIEKIVKKEKKEKNQMNVGEKTSEEKTCLTTNEKLQKGDPGRRRTGERSFAGP